MSEEDVMMLGVGGEGGDMAEDNFQDGSFEPGTINGLTSQSQPLLNSTFNSSPAATYDTTPSQLLRSTLNSSPTATYDIVEMRQVGENSSLLENSCEGDGNG